MLQFVTLQLDRQDIVNKNFMYKTKNMDSTELD